MLQGDQSVFTIPDLFGFIELRQLSGILVIASPSRDRSFYFKQGKLVYALCNDPEQLLGSILVRELGLDPGQVERAIQSAGRTSFLGKELVAAGLLDAGGLNSVVRAQIWRALREVVRWSQWAFAFREIEEPPTLPELRLSAQAFVFDLSRALDEFDEAKQQFEDLLAVPMYDRDLVWVSSSPPPGWDPALPHPAELLEEFDGTKSLRTLLEESRHPALSLARAIGTLVRSGHLVLADRAASLEVSSIATQAYPRLPVHHALVPRIWSVCRADVPDRSALADLIASDPVLAARVLRVGSVQQHWGDYRPLVFSELLERLGLPSLHSILLAEALRGQFFSGPCFAMDDVWQGSARAGSVCGQIAQLCQHPDPDMARAAGLLQDIGRYVLMALDEPLYREVERATRDDGMTLLEAERTYFVTDHCEVGANLLQCWGFPPQLRKVVSDHHRTEFASEPLLQIVELANQVLSGAEPDLELLAALGLSHQDLDALTPEAAAVAAC
ncbi:MAG: HDOD domain-containing protein [Planctomycetota bacterium]